MAKKTVVTLVDDVDGFSEADETVPFGVDGQAMEIDLTAKNAALFRETMRKWVDAARRTGGRRTAKVSPGSGSDAAAIRAWARHNGHAVPRRGRIPRTLIAEFRDAQR